MKAIPGLVDGQSRDCDPLHEITYLPREIETGKSLKECHPLIRHVLSPVQ